MSEEKEPNGTHPPAHPAHSQSYRPSSRSRDSSPAVHSSPARPIRSLIDNATETLSSVLGIKPANSNAPSAEPNVSPNSAAKPDQTSPSHVGQEPEEDYSVKLEHKELEALRARRKRHPSYNHAFLQNTSTYRPIEEHGLIGNMKTCAVISTDAVVTWYCYPHFDSPSIFASILDSVKGGHYTIRCAVDANAAITHRQLYHSETNVLISRFLTDSGVGQVSDFMPVGEASAEGAGWLVRELEVVRGKNVFPS